MRNSQEWHTDARLMASTEETVAWNSNQMKNSRASTARPVTENPVIRIDLETSRGYNILSAESVSFRKRVETRLRVMLNRPPGDKMEDIDKHCLSWRIFLSSSMNAVCFFGRDYSEILHSIRRIKMRDQL